MQEASDLDFCGLMLWIDRRQFPDAVEAWDGNWLCFRARMEADGATVRCDGPFLMTTDIARFRDQLHAMNQTLEGEASLKPLEPALAVVLRMQGRGQIEGVVEITPDHMSQRHRFVVEADQSYLPPLIASCDAILARFPVVGSED
ncbi:WapI family immunity protein [Stakelama tenebrarum]|uniref:Uncharacterized protein n=1 Tax=Stakelama tenebrarum TaxID=2711215 RepID=A0A6G6Y260_9SPHN|nr:hypothetical protein [Sphingosinithalassobacter tenebrarum]QIG78693.1 hypothetical protein G5C33_02080 [Sphingosinithalassobacter tenebrarum]